MANRSDERAVDISPNQVGGILKEIIQQGKGTATPQKGNKVFVHYVGKLTDGTVFDSSRDRNELFEFSLGKGQVIKAWDIGVATMKEGESCKLTCSPEYAYGKAGSPPKIPPDATLVFEIELIKWQLEDLSPSGDGGVQRCVITEGVGDDMPSEGATVEVHLIGKIKEKIVEERDVTFQLGEGCDYGIVEGLEIALKNFKKEETSRILLSPKYAFGTEGKSEWDIAPDSKIEYEVTLKSFEKGKESWEMNVEEKIEQSEIVKNKGTKYFKDGNYERAVKQYKKIINYLQYENGLETNQQKQRDALLLAGYLNLAACYLKLNEPQKVIENSNKALGMDPLNSKGLFRRGQAHFALKDFSQAKSDFEKVMCNGPTNKAAQKQILACVANIKQQLEQEKRLYKNMFEKMYSNEKQNGAAEPTVTK